MYTDFYTRKNLCDLQIRDGNSLVFSNHCTSSCPANDNYRPPSEVCEGNVFTGVFLSTRGACVAGGHVWPGACVTRGVHGRGCAWQEDMCGRGHAWWGEACMSGACMAGDMHGWGVHGRGVHGREICMAGWTCMTRGACMAGEMATAAGGMHPTGMHSC